MIISLLETIIKLEKLDYKYFSFSFQIHNKSIFFIFFDLNSLLSQKYIVKLN